ncbi:MAG: TIGR00289 family protein [Archaeoglobales archaeon]|nr:TIGR00289 family protein [Archaeoglobales archaeon]
MRVAALISGGKDSILALHKIFDGNEVIFLVSAIPERADSYMFHTANIHMVEAVAECLSIPLIKIRVSGEEEKEVEEFAEGLKDLDVDALCVGAIESNYQRRRVEKICKKLGFKLIAPLWKSNPENLLQEVAKKFEAIITSVSAEGLGREFLGRKIDEKLIKELLTLKREKGIHPAGEGGEYETLVLNAPLYKKRILIKDSEIIWRGVSGELVIKNYELVQKF